VCVGGPGRDVMMFDDDVTGSMRLLSPAPRCRHVIYGHGDVEQTAARLYGRSLVDICLSAVRQLGRVLHVMYRNGHCHSTSSSLEDRPPPTHPAAPASHLLFYDL